MYNQGNNILQLSGSQTYFCIFEGLFIIYSLTLSWFQILFLIVNYQMASFE
ncbi:unnamed protein product [Paramecium octaurelia]|uniref:Uncharacterized protein n=1 Tax=Paramecium octaurelia TaxID=43137 RepID=A0A8S1WUZ5_PAROT|nr:unnamed protein product [Paramecium octaurelia]